MATQRVTEPRLVTTYAELARYVKAFVDGFLGLLIIIGGPGLQKSRLVRDMVGAAVCWLTGHLTPLAFYRELYEHRDEPVVIDDIDGIHANPQILRLLRCLCQTDATKFIAWISTASMLDKEGIPRRFETTSPCVIVANEWRTLAENVAALEDRGHVLRFEPTPLEVHLRTADWFGDQEIFDFVGHRLHLVQRPSMRDYELAAQTKRAGLDWRSMLLSRWVTGNTLLVASLKADPSFRREEDRVSAFKEQCGQSRATYFSLARRLRAPVETPSIKLTNPPPDEAPAEPGEGESRRLQLLVPSSSPPHVLPREAESPQSQVLTLPSDAHVG